LLLRLHLVLLVGSVHHHAKVLGLNYAHRVLAHLIARSHLGNTNWNINLLHVLLHDLFIFSRVPLVRIPRLNPLTKCEVALKGRSNL
jgi:hypothetical protein